MRLITAKEAAELAKVRELNPLVLAVNDLIVNRSLCNIREFNLPVYYINHKPEKVRDYRSFIAYFKATGFNVKVIRKRPKFTKLGGDPGDYFPRFIINITW